MKIPAREVRRAPVLKLILPGARLTRAFAGATMLAAMLVESVATRRPACLVALSFLWCGDRYIKLLYKGKAPVMKALACGAALPC